MTDAPPSGTGATNAPDPDATHAVPADADQTGAVPGGPDQTSAVPGGPEQTGAVPADADQTHAVEPEGPQPDPSPFTHPDLGIPGAFVRNLPPPTGRTARGDVDRLTRGDAQRPARGTERGERGGRGDSERLPRIRSSGRSSRTPARVRVTSSRMTATARAPVRSVSREIDEQTGVGEVYLRSLLRAQLRLGLSVIAVLALALGTLPLTFSLIPRLGNVRVLTVPLPWLLVGVSVYPLLFGVAWWHMVAAERAERDFAAIVESD